MIYQYRVGVRGDKDDQTGAQACLQFVTIPGTCEDLRRVIYIRHLIGNVNPACQGL
jgi:hypothetical protein